MKEKLTFSIALISTSITTCFAYLIAKNFGWISVSLSFFNFAVVPLVVSVLIMLGQRFIGVFKGLLSETDCFFLYLNIIGWLVVFLLTFSEGF